MLYVQESHVNASKGYRMSMDEPPFETEFDTTAEVYHHMRSHYHARCTGKVYIDSHPQTGSVAFLEHKAIGWVLVFKDKYEDTGEPFTHEVWVTVHTALPTRTVECHYAEVAS
jgi:hypothetical protein